MGERDIWSFHPSEHVSEKIPWQGLGRSRLARRGAKPSVSLSIALVCGLVLLGCGDDDGRGDIDLDAIDDVDIGAMDTDDDDAPTAGPATCEDAPEGFTPCGGNPVGVWEIELLCQDAGDYDPFDGLCPSLQAEGGGTAEGRMTFTHGGTYRIEYSRNDLDLVFSFPLACFGGSAVPCSGRYYRGATCERALGDETCICGVEQRFRDQVEEGTWVLSTGRLSLRTNDSSHNILHCVEQSAGRMTFLRPTSEAGGPSARVTLRRVLETP